MRVYQGTKSEFVACNLNCADGFKADRAHGLNYGPQPIRDDDGRVFLAQDREEWSYLTECCAYCGAETNLGIAGH